MYFQITTAPCVVSANEIHLRTYTVDQCTHTDTAEHSDMETRRRDGYLWKSSWLHDVLRQPGSVVGHWVCGDHRRSVDRCVTGQQAGRQQGGGRHAVT